MSDPATSFATGYTADLEPKKKTDWADLITSRVTDMPERFVFQNPGLAAQLAASRMEDRTVKHLATHLDTVHQWLDSSTSFADSPGALAHAYVKTTQIADPRERLAGVSTLNAFRALDPEKQTQVLAFLNNPETFAGTNSLAPTQGAPMGREAGNVASPVQQEVAALLPGAQVNPATGEVTVSADLNSQATVDAFLQAFPEMQGHLHFNEGGINLQDIRDSITARGEGLSAAIAKPILEARANGGGFWKTAVGDLEAGGTVLGEALSPVFQDIPKAAGIINEDLTHFGTIGRLASTGLAKYEHYTYGWAARAATNGLGAVQAVFNDTVGDYAARKAGYKPGTESYDNAKNAVGGVIMMIALMGAGEAGGAAKASLTMPDAAAAGQLGLVDAAGNAIQAGEDASASGNASVIETINRLGSKVNFQTGEVQSSLAGNVRAVLAHPFSTLAAPEIKAFVYNALKTAPPDWVETTRAGRFFNGVAQIIEETKGKPQADVEAALQSRYPTLSDELTSRLAKGGADTDVMKQTVVNYFDDLATNADRVNALRAEIADAKSKVQTKVVSEQAQTVIDSVKPVEDQGVRDFLAQTEDRNAALLDQPDNMYQQEFDTAKENGAAQQVVSSERGAIWRNVEDKTYYGVDAEGKVVAHFQDTEGAGITGVTAPSVQRSPMKWGQTMLQQIMEDQGITTPEAVQAFIDEQAMTDAGAGLMKRVATNILTEDRYDLNAAAAQTVAEQALTDAAMKGQPQYKFPGGNSLPEFLHRVLYRPQGSLETLMRRILAPVQTVKTWSNEIFSTEFRNTLETTPAVARLVDKLDFNPKLYNVSRETGTEIPWDATDHNNVVLRRYLGRMDFTNAEVEAHMAAFRAVTSDQEFYQALKSLADHIGAKLDALGNVPPAMRDALTQFWNRNSSSYQLAYPQTISDGRTIYSPILEGPNGESLPFAPNEFVNSAHELPSLRNVEEAMSSMKRWAENARAAGGGAKFAANTYEASRALLHMSTAVFKPLSLILKIPAIILRKNIDEALGNAVTPGITSPIKTTNELAQDMFQLKPEDIGNPTAGAFESYSSGVPFVEEVKTSDLVNRGAVNDPGIWSSQYNSVRFIYSDPMLRKFVQTGLDVDRMAALLRGGDEYLTALFDRGGAVNLERAGATLEETLTRLKAHIEGLAGGDADIMQSMATGKLSRNAGGVSATQVSGSSVSATYDNLRSDRLSLQLRIDELSPLDHDLKALQDQLAVTNERIAQMEKQFDAGMLNKGSEFIGMNEEQAFANELKRRYSTGSYELPERIRVDRFGAQGEYQAASVAEHVDQAAGAISSGAYRRFKTIGEMEAKWARGTYYQQRAWNYYQGLKGLGVEDMQAQSIAAMKALNDTKDFFYDLTARSSMERNMRNIFWYAPVTGELMYRWLYALPAETGTALTGLALNTAKAVNYLHLAMDFGLIQKDEVSGAYVIPVPGLGSFLQRMSGGQLNFNGLNLDVPVSSLSHLSVGNLVPGLAPMPAKILSVMATKYGGPFKSLAGVIAPAGNSTTIVPTGVRYAMEMFGMKPPDVSNDYINTQYDKTRDVALQYAFADLQKQGDLPPTLAEFHLDKSQPDYNLTPENQAAYMAKWKPWFDRLNADAQSYSNSIFFLKSVTSTLFPGQIEYSTQEQEDYQKFFTDNILPQIDPTTHKMSAEAQQSLDKWLADHPGSLAYSISYNYYTGKQYDLPYKDTGDSYNRDLYAAGLKTSMNPTDYAQYLAAATSHAHYIATQNASLHAISPNMDPAQIMFNWGQRSAAIAAANVNWENYLKMNRDARAIVDKVTAGYADFKGEAPDSLQVQYATDALTSLQALSNEFTGVGGVTDDQYNQVMSNLKAIRAQNYQDSGGVQTPLVEGMNWYFDTILTPYMDATKALYDQASNLSSSGQNASAVYSQIEAIKNSYTGSVLVHNGETYPTPDEFFMGGKTELQQSYAKISLQTKPISWLSDSQRTLAGYTSFTGEDEMWTKIKDINTMAVTALQKNNVSSGSLAYDAVQKWIDTQSAAVAATYGPAGVAAYNLDQQAPYVRLQTQGFGSNDPIMQQAYAAATQITQGLTKDGISPKGSTSQEAVSAKTAFYDWIQSNMGDPTFAADMQTLSASLPLPNGSGRTKALLWEAVFFGQFNQAYINPDFLNSF